MFVYDAPIWVYYLALAVFLVFGVGFGVYEYRKYKSGTWALVSGFLVGAVASIVFLVAAAG